MREKNQENPSPFMESGGLERPKQQPNIHQAFAALSARQDRIESLVDKNNNIFCDSFNVSEAQIAVLQKAMNDLLHGKVRISDVAYDVSADGVAYKAIDFQSYLVEFYICQTFAEFALGLASFNPERRKPLLALPDAEADTVFGG